MKRWWAGLGLAAILFWGFARLPLSLYPAAGADLRINIDECNVPSVDTERAWLEQESRIRSAYPQCRLRWTFSGGNQQIEIGGRYEPRVTTEIVQWASLKFPGAIVRVPAEQKPVLPCFLIHAPATDWDATALWTERVLGPSVASTKGVERLEITPAPRQVLWISLDPHRLAAAGLTVKYIRSVITNARSVPAGPFELGVALLERHGSTGVRWCMGRSLT